MKARILIVDDEIAICDYLCTYLNAQGFQTMAAQTPEQGLQLIDAQPVDLVVLDIALGEADGLEVLETIKFAHPDLPVIMLTGMGYDEELIAEALSKHASGYLSKTLPPAQLLLEIKHTLCGAYAHA
ncbi:MAG: response regulator [Verrucomicrobiota bacterium]